ncbi:MAG TPA: NAD+ synthase [Treponema sp.]|nr:MAG: NAD+ synthase [Treponema sp. GWC1_61_84]HCM27908.1 NAD+ synthase [Treponema sp.]
MRIAIAQIDSIVGDFAGNADKIVRFAVRARAEHAAELVVFPELALCGYPPMDLLDQESFAELSERSLRSLQNRLPRDIAVGVGYVGRNTMASGKALVNSYALLLDGTVAFEQEKTLLPTYDVFDEARYFESARERRVFAWKGERIGIAICEDLWWESENATGFRYAIDPVRELLDRGSTIMLVPSASPFVRGKFEVRRKLAERVASRGGIPVIYANAVGANDSIVFDGRSFVVAPASGSASAGPLGAASLRAVARGFEEDLLLWDSVAGNGKSSPAKAETNELDVIEEALVLGIRGYMQKCGFVRAHLGLSGGIDSALVAYLASRAIGADKLVCFGLPSRFSSEGSRTDARRLAENLGARFVMLPIEGAFEAYLDTLEEVFEGKPFDLAEENLQARIRGTLLMAYSNKFESMLLTTGNKSELAMGYCTLYGDMCGALAPIGDLLKTEVFALCRRINERAIQSDGEPVIPVETLTKPPSAELRPNQTDQDSLPPYDVLDAVLSLHLIDNLSRAEIVERGWTDELASRVVKAVARAEYKRRQAPPVIKVSPRAFGMGRRMPIARSPYEA